MTDLSPTRDPARTAGPRRSHVFVERPRLDRRYTESTGRVLRVVAPAGYGKSALVSRWVDDEPRPVRWLDLERLDNDPLVITATLEKCLAPMAGGAIEAVHGDREFSGIRRSLAGLVRSAPPFVLVLDDAHHLDTSTSIDLITCVAEELPPESTLVLIGRSFQGWPTAALRLDPGVTDVTADDLAFDLGETEQLLGQLGLEAELDLVARLHHRFEGWPAGLRLAALANSADPPSAAGSNDLDRLSFVTEYLAQEWLGGLETDDRDLLMSLACLRQFDAEMCDAVLERPDSGAALEHLAEVGTIIVPVSARSGWFRVRSVVSDVLTAELRNRDRSRWCAIHSAAASWWAAAGNPDLAIDHAATAGDLEACERLIVAEGPAYMASGRHTTVERWLSRFSDERIAAVPDLCFLASIVALQSGTGDRAERFARLFPDVIAGQPTAIVARGRSLRGVMSHCPAGESIEEIDATIGSIQAGPWRVTVRWALGVNLFLVGDERALEVLRTAEAECAVFEMPVARANLMASIAAIELIGGHWDESTRLTRQAVEAVAEHRAESVTTTAIVSAAAALVEAGAGRHDLARGAVEQAHGHLDSMKNAAPWLTTLGRLTLVRACLLLDDPLLGRSIVDDLVRSRAHDPRIAVDERIDQLSSELDALSKVHSGGTPTLTDAELRVLQHLPTNLSLAEIARRLYVSRNTVKSHVAAIYRKLGTTTRGEAVDLATGAGILVSARRDTG